MENKRLVYETTKKKRKRNDRFYAIFKKSFLEKGFFFKNDTVGKNTFINFFKRQPFVNNVFIREKIYFWSENFQVISLHKKNI